MLHLTNTDFVAPARISLAEDFANRVNREQELASLGYRETIYGIVRIAPWNAYHPVEGR